MAFKMKGYSGFHGKKKPTLYKSIELEQMASGKSDYADTPIEDYDKITDERLPIYEHEPLGTFPRGGKRDYFDNRALKGDNLKGNYPQGYNFDPNPDTASSRGGGTFNLTPKALEQIKYMDPKKLSDKDKAIRKSIMSASVGKVKDRDWKIELQPNKFLGVKEKDGKLSNTWSVGRAGFTQEGVDGYTDILDQRKFNNAELIDFLLNINTGEFAMKKPFDLETIPVGDEGSGVIIPRKEPGPIETRKLPDPKPPGEREKVGGVSVGKITGGEVIPEKTGEIPWDRAPKVGTDARKKFYDQYNLRYDDTIKGYNRDGSRVEPVRRDDSSEKTATSRKKSRKRDSKKSRGRKGLNLPDLAWDFSDWDRPIREFFGQ